jgi:hypothetical protein
MSRTGWPRAFAVSGPGTIGFVGDTVATTPDSVGMVLGALEQARAADRVVLLMTSTRR